MGGLLLVRADATAGIGMGHVMRCLALAEAWRERGGSALFRMSGPPDAVRARLATERVALEDVSVEAGSEADARATAERARLAPAEAVVVDGYRFGPSFLAALRSGTELPILVVDDLGGEGPWPADFILNQNLHAVESDYPQRAPGAELLLGPRFALLRSEVIGAQTADRPTPETAESILAAFGGSDPVDATSRLLPDLARLARTHRVRLLVGPANPRRESLERAARETAEGQVEIVPAGADYARLLSESDLVVTAAGSTCWELCFLGIPFVTVVVAENQTPIASSLAEAGPSVDLGWHGRIAPGTLADTVERLAGDAVRRRAMSLAGRALVDGRGAGRAASRIAARKAA